MIDAPSGLPADFEMGSFPPQTGDFDRDGLMDVVVGGAYGSMKGLFLFWGHDEWSAPPGSASKSRLDGERFRSATAMGFSRGDRRECTHLQRARGHRAWKVGCDKSSHGSRQRKAPAPHNGKRRVAEVLNSHEPACR